MPARPVRPSRWGLLVALAALGGCKPSAGGSGPSASASVPSATSPTPAQIATLLYGDEAFRQKLRAAVTAKGPDYTPRTKHKEADGRAKFVNRLILERSPYLLQHAHNPVNWFPWGDEAFALAEKLGRPVFLSVGYSTCHWCHVMEEESFEDEAIAEYINSHYVPIKVDREERPDVDAIYMRSVQLLTRRGGWPMSVWLTPDRRPFYGGTYFPARDGDRGVTRGFLTLLQEQHDAFTKHPDQVADDASRLASAVSDGMKPPSAASDLPGATELQRSASLAARRFDPTWGGNKGAPKFPSSFPVRNLLRHYRRSGDEKARDMALTTLRKMAAGGMYDHVGGGFHRYSVDGEWLVPHFEKMLYDNALLSVSYLEGFQVSGDPDLARVAREILDYVLRDMTSPAGAFYSATDADSIGPKGHREEGYYFTWTPTELAAVLTAEEAEAVRAYYAVTPDGNFEGRSILHTPKPRAEVAEALGVKKDELAARLAGAQKKLLAARGKRPAPLRDDKHITAWNGLMIAALARAGRVLDDARYTSAATRAATFVETQLRVDGELRHSMLGRVSPTPAFAEDQAFYALGLVELFQATSEPKWLEAAVRCMTTLDRAYRSPTGAFYRTTNNHEKLLARQVEQYDGAIPAASSVALLVELMLHSFTTDDAWRQRAEKTMKGLAGVLRERPFALEDMLIGVDFHDDVAKEVLIALPEDAEKGSADALLATFRQHFSPNTVFVLRRGDATHALVPWMKGKKPKGGDTATAYVCELGACELPTTDPKVFAKQLAKVVPYAGGTP